MPMGNATINYPADILKAFDPQHGQGVVAFVGSGPSCDAGLPSWRDLLYRIAVETELDKGVEPYLERGDFLGVAQFLARERWDRDIQERAAKQIKEASSDPGPLHKLIVSLPFTGIITTNYDLLLTMADKSRRFSLPITHQNTSLRSHLRGHFILHLHGHVDDPGTIVLTRHGYDEIVFESPATKQFLSTVFQTRAVLFIGFGFADNHVDNMLREFKDIVVGGASVFALLPSQSPTQPDKVRDQNLKDRSINPIYLEDRGDYGVGDLCIWLDTLRSDLDQITLSCSHSVQSLRPDHLVEGLRQQLISDEYFPLLADALSKLPNRPDLRNLVRTGPSKHEVKELFSRLGLSEMRSVLMTLNQAQRHPTLEDALSCFPP